MGTVHKLLEEKGRQGVLQLGMLERAEVEAAATYMADEDAAIGFLYSGWCFASLPHRRLPDSEIWQVRGDRLTLLVNPVSGSRPRARQSLSACLTAPAPD